MGVRGEVFSTKVALPNRTYFFNVKENRMGDLYLNIVESKNRETGGFDRQSVILFADDLQEFLKGFEESLRVLEKSVRGKKKGGESQRPRREDRGEKREGKPERGAARSNDRGSSANRKSGRATDRNADRKPRTSGDSFKGKGKRVVVKKR